MVIDESKFTKSSCDGDDKGISGVLPPDATDPSDKPKKHGKIAGIIAIISAITGSIVTILTLIFKNII